MDPSQVPVGRARTSFSEGPVVFADMTWYRLAPSLQPNLRQRRWHWTPGLRVRVARPSCPAATALSAIDNPHPGPGQPAEQLPGPAVCATFGYVTVTKDRVIADPTCSNSERSQIALVAAVST